MLYHLELTTFFSPPLTPRPSTGSEFCTLYFSFSNIYPSHTSLILLLSINNIISSLSPPSGGYLMTLHYTVTIIAGTTMTKYLQQLNNIHVVLDQLNEISHGTCDDLSNTNTKKHNLFNQQVASLKYPRLTFIWSFTLRSEL